MRDASSCARRRTSSVASNMRGGWRSRPPDGRAGDLSVGTFPAADVRILPPAPTDGRAPAPPAADPAQQVRRRSRHRTAHRGARRRVRARAVRCGRTRGRGAAARADRGRAPGAPCTGATQAHPGAPAPRPAVHHDGAGARAGAARRDRLALSARAHPDARRVERRQRARAPATGPGGPWIRAAARLGRRAAAAGRRAQAARPTTLSRRCRSRRVEGRQVSPLVRAFVDLVCESLRRGKTSHVSRDGPESLSRVRAGR